MAEKSNYYTGLEISKNYLRLVQLRKDRSEWHLETCIQKEIPPNTLHISIKEGSVKDTENFDKTLQEVLKNVRIKDREIAVSLPNQMAKLSLMPLNVSLMDNEEAIQTIKWKLRGVIPYEPENMRVGFQEVSKGKDGEDVILAVVINKHIIEQFEYLLSKRHLKPKFIGVSALNSLNLYSEYLKENNFSMILSLFEDYFFFAAFTEGKLSYFRGKKVSLPSASSLRDISSTTDYYLAEVVETAGINKLGISGETKHVDHLLYTLNKLYRFEIHALTPSAVLPSVNDMQGGVPTNLFTSAIGAAQMLYYG